MLSSDHICTVLIGRSYFDQSVMCTCLDFSCLLGFCWVCPENFPSKGLKILPIGLRGTRTHDLVFASQTRQPFGHHNPTVQHWPPYGRAADLLILTPQSLPAQQLQVNPEINAKKEKKKKNI